MCMSSPIIDVVVCRGSSIEALAGEVRKISYGWSGSRKLVEPDCFLVGREGCREGMVRRKENIICTIQISHKS
jgi:hypothetical protein